MSHESAVRTRRAVDVSWRWPRAGVFALAMTALAAGAHALAGGALPAPALVILGGLLVSCLTFPVAGREHHAAVVLAATAAAQLGLHAFFTLSMTLDANAMTMPGGRPDPMTAGTMSMGTTAGSGTSVSMLMTSLSTTPLSPGMLVAHASAAALVAVALRTGERALLDLVATLRWLVIAVLAVFADRLGVTDQPTGLRLRLTDPADPARSDGRTRGFDGRAPPVCPAR